MTDLPLWFVHLVAALAVLGLLYWSAHLGKWQFLILALALSAMIAIGVETYAHEYDITSHSFDPSFRNEINRVRPDIILIGNSMLKRNVNKTIFDSELSRLTARPVKSVFIQADGVASAWWYLALKNQVAASEMSDIPVGILFRGDYLSRPKHRITGQYYTRLMTMYSGEEPIVDRKVFDKSTSSLLHLSTMKRRDNISTTIRDKFLAMFGSASLRQDEESIKDLFDLENLDAAESEDHGVEDFDAALSESLLPDMVDEGRSFTLFFVEAHTRPPQPHGKWLLDYRVGLEAYLANRHLPLIKMYNHSELDRTELYVDEAHFGYEGKKINAKLLAQEIYDEGLVK